MTARILHLRSAPPAAVKAGAVPSPGGLWRRIVCGLAAADRLHRERRYLAGLDDRSLRDIGITRPDVEAELRRPVNWLGLILRC